MKTVFLLCAMSAAALSQTITVTPATATIHKKAGAGDDYQPRITLSGDCSATVTWTSQQVNGTWTTSALADVKNWTTAATISSGATITPGTSFYIRMNGGNYNDWLMNTASLGDQSGRKWVFTFTGQGACAGQVATSEISMLVVPGLPTANDSMLGEAPMVADCTNNQTTAFWYRELCPAPVAGERGGQIGPSTDPLAVSQEKETFTDPFTGTQVTALSIGKVTEYAMISAVNADDTKAILVGQLGTSGGVYDIATDTLIESISPGTPGSIGGFYSWYGPESGHSADTYLHMSYSTGQVYRKVVGGADTLLFTVPAPASGTMRMCIGNDNDMSGDGWFAFFRVTGLTTCASFPTSSITHFCAADVRGAGSYTCVEASRPYIETTVTNTNAIHMTEKDRVSGVRYMVLKEDPAASVLSVTDDGTITQLGIIDLPSHGNGDGVHSTGETSMAGTDHCDWARDELGQVELICHYELGVGEYGGRHYIVGVRLNTLPNGTNAELGGAKREILVWADSTGTGSTHLGCSKTVPGVCAYGNMAVIDGTFTNFPGRLGYKVTGATATSPAVITVTPDINPTTASTTGIAVGDYVNIGASFKDSTTGNGYVGCLRGEWEVSAITTNTITLAGTDCTSATTFPAGGVMGLIKNYTRSQTWENRGVVFVFTTHTTQPSARRMIFTRQQGWCPANGTWTNCQTYDSATGYWTLPKSSMSISGRTVAWSTDFFYPGEPRTAYATVPDFHPDGLSSHAVSSGTSAVVSYTLPEQKACALKYGSHSPMLPPLRSTTTSENAVASQGEFLLTGLSADTMYWYQVRCNSDTPDYVHRGSFKTGSAGTTDVVLTHPSATATTMTVNYGSTIVLGSSASNTSCTVGQPCRVAISGASKGLLYFNWNGGTTATTIAR